MKRTIRLVAKVKRRFQGTGLFCIFLQLVVLCALISVPCGLFAQELTGLVTDSQGAVIPKAQVKVHNQSTNDEISTVATATGNYTVTYLKPGVYTVSANAPGFKQEQKADLVLQVGQTARIDFHLQVGSAAETVTVTANTVIDSSSDRGEVVENEQVTELPINGRDPDMLSVLNAGVFWTGSQQWTRPFDSTIANLNVNGGQTSNNELLIDGASNESEGQDGNGRSAYVPPVDALQEFKIILNPYDAQYGRAVGGIVEMTLKSGTNQLHGSVYEYARREWLDSNTWQNDYYGNTKAAHKLDQYGAELDGPVRIPKVYNGTDKLFFAAVYERWNEVVPSTLVGSVPSPQWLKGDFSNLVEYDGTPITIYNPLSLHKDQNGNLVRDPFPGNIIPTGYINQFASNVISYFPAPNFTPPSGQNPFANNYEAANPTTDEYRNAMLKLDYNLSEKDKFSLRYGYWDRTEYRSSEGLPGPVDNGQLPGGTRSHTFTANWTHTQTPNLIFAFDATANVREDFQDSGPSYFDLSKLGFSSSQLAQFNATSPYHHFPQIGFSEFDTLGNWGDHAAIGNALSMIPSMTWNKGRHTIHAGLDWRILQVGVPTNQDGQMLWTDRTWSQKNYIPSQWDAASGNSFASWLLGTATNGTFYVNSNSFSSQHYYAMFVQDDWKLSRKLTLNLGVRWDLNGPKVERHNRWNGPFQFDADNPVNNDPNLVVADLPNGATLKGGISFLGTNGNIRSLYHLNKGDIQPRIGFAYAVNDKTLVRGGIGEMFENPSFWGNMVGFSSTTSYQATLDNWQTPLINLSNPYPHVIQPAGAASSLETSLGQGYSYSNPHYTLPSFWTYSFGIERQLASHDVIEISYDGSRTRNLDSSLNMNPVSEQWNAQCNVVLGGNPDICNLDLVPNPFQDVAAFQGTGFYGAPTVQSNFLTRPYPAFGDITENQLNQRRSWYNSLQVVGTHRWSKSLTLHATWTWSKFMDAGGWTDQTYQVPYRSLDGGDRPQRITLDGVYLLPVGHGRPLFGNANRYINGVIGGWELSPSYIHETGTPWTTGSSLYYVNHAGMSRHLDSTNGFVRGIDACVAQWEKDPTSGQWSVVPLYSTPGKPGLYTCQSGHTDFIVQPQYAANQNVVYTGIRIPNKNQFDAGLSKNFPIHDRATFQFRLEAFNVLNHPEWQDGYDNNPQDSTFGEIERGPSGQSNLPRECQLSLKIKW